LRLTPSKLTTETLEIINVLIGAGVVIAIVFMLWRLTVNNIK